MNLNNKSLKVLKYIYDNPYTQSIVLSCVPHRSIDQNYVDEIIQTLASKGLISCRVACNRESDIDKAELDSANPDAYLVCLPEGEAAVEQYIYLKKDMLITRTLSIIALIVSFAAMFISPYLAAYFNR